MANNLTSNPIRVDTAGSILNAVEGDLVSCLQWCDDASAAGGALAANDALEMLINGVSVKVKCSTPWAEVWKPTFIDAARIFNLTVTKIDGGTLYIWKA